MSGDLDRHVRRHVFTAAGLPPGVTIDENTGALSGEPPAPGPWSYTITRSAVLAWPWSWLRALRLTRGRAPVTRRPVEVPGTGVLDLERFLSAQWAAVPASLRQRAGWVMDGFWWQWCQELGRPAAGVPALGFPAGSESRPFLFGRPVEITAGAGWPHLRAVGS